jgi:hypothetical protein
MFIRGQRVTNCSPLISRYEPKGFVIENQRWDPITATASATLSTFSGLTQSTANIFVKPAQIRRVGSSPQLQAVGAKPSPLNSSDSELHRNGSPSRSRSKEDLISDTQSIKSQNLSKHESHGKTHVAASMALASASGVGGFFKHYAKGFLLDMPLAFAEGSRAVPKLYGEEVADYGTVKDWKSGFIKSGKSLTLGLGSGLADLVVQPYEGAKEKGAVGAIAGIGKGVLGFSSKASSGKSLRSFLCHSPPIPLLFFCLK